MDNGSVPSLDEEELTLPIAAVNKLIKEAVPKYRVSHFKSGVPSMEHPWNHKMLFNSVVQKANWMISG